MKKLAIHHVFTSQLVPGKLLSSFWFHKNAATLGKLAFPYLLLCHKTSTVSSNCGTSRLSFSMQRKVGAVRLALDRVQKYSSNVFCLVE